MRRALALCTLLLCFSTSVAAQSSKPDPKAQTKPPVRSEPVSLAAKQAARAAFAELPLSFEENRGQSDARVKYLSRGAGYNLFLTGDEAVISLHGGAGSGGSSTSPTGSAALWLKMLGGNSSASISSSDLLPGKINYYIGNDPSKWRTGVRQFGRVTYRGIYPGVDLTYYGNQRQLESDFVVSPGANPRAIEFEIRGARETRLDAQGNLVLVTDAGNAQLLRPGIYQMIHGVRHDVPGSYKLRGNADGKYRVGFEIAKYDTHSTLIIDPTLVYSTYVGGSSTGTGDGAQGIAVDASGHAWITGSGSSTDFPGSNIGPPNPSLSSFAFVTELDQSGSSGTSLVYSTIIAGSNSDQNTAGNGISIDSSGNAYIAGTTGSTNFPLLNPFQGTFGGASQSGIVVGLAPGGTLLYSTYFGGRNGLGANGNSDVTILNGIYADPPTGNTYIVGDTTSANFPTINPLQATLNVSTPDEALKNVVVAKFNPQGQPVYSTYLSGTNSNDVGNAIVADSNGNAYITGQTVSSTFPIQTSVTPFQNKLNSPSGNVFVTKLSFSGSALTLTGGSFLGGAGIDQGWGIAIDSANPPNIYVTGQTTSVGTGTNPFPTKNPISGTFTSGAYSGATSAGGTDAFVTKISGDFTTLVYSTFLGGLSTDVAYAIALDNANPPNAYVTGSTSSSNFPMQNPLQSALGNPAATNAFVAEISGTGATVNFSTFFGGISGDLAHGIALDSTNNFYIAGKTNSTNFPVVGASGANPFQGQLGTSTGNAFVAKFSPAAPASALTFFPPSYNFHTVGIGGTLGFATEPVTLTNNTGSDVSISALVMGGANSGDFTIQSASPSPCSATVFPFTLKKGSSCTLLLRFTPSDQDTRSATLSVTSNASSSNVLNLTGSGGAPQVSFSPATLTIFPNPDPLNVQAGAFVTVTNSGGGPLTIGSVQISAADAADAAPFSILSGCASTTLNPGSSCSIEIAYTPTTATTSNATLLLNTNAAGSPQTLPLTGTGVAEVIVQPTSIEYMQQIVGTSVTNAMNDAREYIVENGSGANITLTVTHGTSASQGDFQVENEAGLNTCVTGLVLAPGGECETIIFFLPTAVSSVDGRMGSYTVAWNGPIAGSQVVNLMGQGVTGIFLLTNTITAANEYVGFTEGANTLEALFNGTSNPITVSIALTGNNPSDFAVSLDQSCAPNNVVPANTFCRVNTSFTPSALGLRSVTALFDYTGDGGDPLTLNGSGTGIPGPVVITVANRQVSTYDFGSEIINTTTPETRFLVRNVATVPATISSITPPGNSDFKFTSDSTCAASGTLQGGSSCFIGVTFSPSSVTNPPTKESTTFTFGDTYAASVGADASSPHTITITGTGEPSLITISVSTGTSTLLDFGTVNLKPASPPIAEIFLTNASNTATVINWSGGSPALDTPTGTDFSFSTSGVNITTCTNGKTVLPQGGSCQIAIQFNPQTGGMQTNSVTFTDTVSGGSPTTHKVMIQGNSVGQGQVSMTSTLTYTQLVNTTSAAQTTTVTNTGAGPLTITQTLIDNFGTGTGQFNILPSSTCTTGTTLSPTSPGNTCTFNITFAAPGTAGLSEAEIEVEANIGNNGTGFGDTFLQGTAVTGGLALSPAGTINFGTAAVGTTVNNNVFYSLTNNNTVSVTLGMISVPSGYAVIGDSCSSVTVMPTLTCGFELSFTPTSATSFNGNLSVTFTGAGSTGSPFSVAIQGSGSSAVVANPNPAIIQFASVGSQTFADITIENGSASAATITGVSSFSGANPSDFTIPTGDNFCPNATVLSGTTGTTSGGSCFIEVAFLSSASGNFSAQFNVSYSISGTAQTPVTVVLNASIPAVQVSITPGTLTFPNQTLNTQSQVKFITITNTSPANSSLYFEPTNIQITGNDFAIGPSTGGSSCSFIQPGQSCTLPIIFTPSSRDSVGPVAGTLSITANTSPATQTVTLNGTASTGAVSTETTNMSFPTTNVGSSTAQAILLSNTTSSSVTLSGLAYTGPYGPGTGPNACGTVNPVPATTGTCLIYVKFTPTGGATSGTLIVSYNSGSVALPTINFTGSQSNPVVSLTPSPTLTFPTVLEGSSVTMTATLTNGTASGITISSTPIVTTPGNATGDFTFASNTCTSGATVASGGGSCTIGVKFAPLGLGSRTATLSVTDSEGTHTIGLSGTGTTPATITATGGATQSVPVNTAFTALQATVKDANLNTLPGVSVTFTAPAAGASGKFSNGTNTITITTDANGVATATFTANSIPSGTAYTVTASAGAVGPANFTLTNLPGTPASITATAGTPQSAAINVAFTTALQATVKDSSNLPLDGVSVTFTAPAAGASGKFANNTNTVTVTTDVNGIATATTFTANSTSGGPYTVTATAGAFTANFSLTNLAGAPATITATQGATQSTTISTAFPTLMQAAVKDAGNNLLSGATVTFTVVPAGNGASGTLSGGTNSGTTITETTNASGIATAPVFTANGIAGIYSVTASVSGVATPAQFSLTNNAGPPASIVTKAGTPQSIAVNTAFASTLQATVTDSGGNPVSGASVTFTAPASGASGTFAAPGTGITAVVTTNSSGVAASPIFTSNSTIGSYSVNATVSGVSTPAAFSMTNVAGPPSSIVTNAGTPQNVAINTPFPTALQAKVTDSGGNPVTGASVTFTAPATGASGTFAAPGAGNTATVTTNSSGLATAPAFTSNSTAAAYTVNATVTGVATPAAFSLTNNPGPAAAIVANAGTSQNVAINTAFPTNLQAKVTDSGGNPVSGASVTFAAPATGASGTFAAPGTGNTATVTTNASGLATAPVFTSNSTAAAYTVNATATGVATPAAFSLTNTAGPAKTIVTNAGTPQNVAINTAFPTALQAKVTDSGGNPVSGASVTFTAPASGASGTFAAPGTGNTAVVTTNSSGLATAPAFTSNSTAGAFTVNATVTGVVTPAAFSLTNNAGPATSIVAGAGTPQSIAINTAFATALQAKVTDSGGNPVSGATVTFTAPASGTSGTFAAPGTGNTATVTTNASGLATAPTFTANSISGGPYTVAATTGSLTAANFSLTNLTAPPAAILATTGSGQSAVINVAFTTNLQATVNDSGGHPIAGASVTFTAPATGASGTFVSPGTGNSATVTTNASGVATAPVYTANGTAGGPYNVTATAGTVSVNFSMTNLVGPPSNVTASAGTPQNVTIGATYPTALKATVKDSGGNLLSGIVVTFTAPASGASGTFASPGTGNTATATTVNGVATAPAFSANTTAGGYTVNATVTGVATPATFSLTNNPGPPATIITNSGTPQSVAVNTAFATMQVTVKDGSGNGVSGVSVTFTAPASGPSGTFAAPGSGNVAVVTTNTSGVAAAPTFTANNTPGGSYTVTAGVSGLTAATFTLTNLAGTPASIVTTSGTPQSVAIGTAFAPLTATVKDSNSIPLSGVIVTFTAPTSGPSGTFTGGVTMTTAITNTSGLATAPTFTANGTSGGPYNVGATAGTLAAVNFSLTNLSGPPATVTATAGTPQSIAISTPFPVQLQATVKDNGGNLLSGVIVTFTAPGSGASGTFTGNVATLPVTTNASGVASAAFTANSTVGAYMVNATVSGVATPAAFSLTNTSGPPTTIVTNAGTPQSVTISTAFTTNLQAKVTDSGGNPVSGASVIFTAPASGASGTFAAPGNGPTATVTTNAAGLATAPVFTANGTSGGYTVNATVTGVATPAAFSLTNLAGPPASITATATPLPTPVTMLFASALQATVKDSGGNLISGASVTFTAPSSGASGTFTGGTNGGLTAVVTTNSSGVATAPAFTANATGGTYNVNATVTGVATPAVFALTNTVSPDVTIAKSHTADFVVGANDTYSIKLTNNGTGPTTGTITVTDTLPTGLTFVSGVGTGWSCSAAAQLVTCTNATVGALAAKGGASTITLTVSVGPTAISSPTTFTLTNSATVSDPGDLNTTDKSSTDLSTQIDNAVPTQTAFSPTAGLNAGATSAQTITLTGTGFNSSTQVTIGSNPALTGTANAAGTSLTITVPVADLATAGNVIISVTNPANPNSHNGGGPATANQTFPLVGVIATQDPSTSGTIAITAGTPAMVKIDFTTTPANSLLPSAITIACQVPMTLTGLTCVPGTTTIAQGSTSGSSTVTLNGVPVSASRTIPVGGGGPRNPYLPWLVALALAAMAGMIVTSRTSRGRAWQVRRAPAYAMLLLLVVTGMALVGCTTASTPATPTPTGPASVVVTATAADGATSSVTVQINVSN